MKRRRSLCFLLASCFSLLPIATMADDAAGIGKLPSIDDSLLHNTSVNYKAVQQPMTEFAAELQQKLHEKQHHIKVIYKGAPGEDIPLATLNDCSEKSAVSLNALLRDACEEGKCGYLLHKHTIIIYADCKKLFQTTLKLPKGFITSANEIIQTNYGPRIKTEMGIIRMEKGHAASYNEGTHELTLVAPASWLYDLNHYLASRRFIKNMDSKKYSIACRGKKFGECMTALRDAMKPDFGKVLFLLDGSSLGSRSELSEKLISLPDIKEKTPRQILRQLCAHVNREFKTAPRQPGIRIGIPNSQCASKTWKVELNPHSEGYDIDDASLLSYVSSRGSNYEFSAHYDPAKKELRVQADAETLDSVDKKLQRIAMEQEEKQLCQWSWKIAKSFLEEEDSYYAPMLQADAEWFVYEMAYINFVEVKGSGAVFKGGKLTVRHNRKALERLHSALLDHNRKGEVISAIGEIKPLSPEAVQKARAQKRKPRKVKLKGDLGKMQREYYEGREAEEREMGGSYL